MTEPFPFDEIESDRNVCLEKILNAPYDSVIGYIIEVDLTYPEEIKENTETFQTVVNIKFSSLILLLKLRN